MGHFDFLTLTVQTKRTGATNVQIRLFLKETQQLKKINKIKVLLRKDCLLELWVIKIFLGNVGEKVQLYFRAYNNSSEKGSLGKFHKELSM